MQGGQHKKKGRWVIYKHIGSGKSVDKIVPNGGQGPLFNLHVGHFIAVSPGCVVHASGIAAGGLVAGGKPSRTN